MRGRGIPAFVLAAITCCTRGDRNHEADDVSSRAAAERAAQTPRRVDTGELMLRRLACGGECPGYTAFVGIDGRVFYHGRIHAKRQGLHTGTLDPSSVERLLASALDGGYFDTRHVYDGGFTHGRVAHTSVVVDGRRHWVRNRHGAAPESVENLEAGIDELLEDVRWDDTPRFGAATGEVCIELGHAIESRCSAFLELRALGGDCDHWLNVWVGLAPSGHDDDGEARPQRCARQLQSLSSAEPTPVRSQPESSLPPVCETWFTETPSKCRSALLRGEHDLSCLAAERTIAIIVETLNHHELDASTRRRIAEHHCRTFNGRR